MRPTPNVLGLVGVILSMGLTLPSRVPAQDSTSHADRPFETWTMVLPYRRGVTIWARNQTTDTVAITRVTLSACFNISNACGPTDLDLKLGPEDSAEVMTLRPKVWDDRYAYQVAWEWSFPSDLRVAASDSGDEDQPPFDVWVRPSADRGELALMARNTSTDAIMVTHLVVSACKNIANGCGSIPLKLRLAPGDSAEAAVIRPDHWGESFNFNLKWEWTWPTGTP